MVNIMIQHATRGLPPKKQVEHVWSAVSGWPRRRKGHWWKAAVWTRLQHLFVRKKRICHFYPNNLLFILAKENHVWFV